MEKGSFVIVHLTAPKEQFWGLLHGVDATGVTLRGINMVSFEDWARQTARGGEKTMDAVLMFFPMHRVERMFLDEDMGVVPSQARRFLEIVGRSARDYFERMFDASPRVD